MNYRNLGIKLNKRELLFCSIDKKLFNLSFNRYSDELGNKLYTISHYSPFGINNFLDNITLYPNNETLLSYAKYDYYDYLKFLCNNLDIDISKINFNEENEDKIFEIIIDKAIELKSMNDEYEFKRKFPTLSNYYYNIVNNKSDYIKEFEKGFKPILFGEQKRTNNSPVVFKKNSSFCECQFDIIYHILRHRKDIKELFNSYTIPREMFLGKKMNNDKFLLYLLSKYIEKYDTLTTIDDKSALLEMIRKNIHMFKDENIYVYIDNRKVTYKEVMREINRILDGRSKGKTVYIDGDIVTSGHSKNHQNNNPERKVKKLTIDERDVLINYNEELLDFYENSGYIGKLVVRNGIEGDLAFVYPNGEILVDYIAQDDTDSSLKKLKERGIYHFCIGNFNQFHGGSRMRLRTELKKNRPGSLVFTTHAGNWQERAKKMIDEGIDDVFNLEHTKLFLEEQERINLKNRKRT